MGSEIKIERGYFGLGDSVNVVQVTSTADFTVNIWARNVGTFHGVCRSTHRPASFEHRALPVMRTGSSSPFQRRPGLISVSLAVVATR